MQEREGDRREQRRFAVVMALVVFAAAIACQQLPKLDGTLVSSRFEVAAHMQASREMQLSGEPFAQILNYNLAGFDRTLTTTDQYCASINCPDSGPYLTDPLGYALAVESYEYSKQPMNNLSFEAGAGMSLMYGPVLNPTQDGGDVGAAILAARFQQFGAEANASGPPGSGQLILAPAPLGTEPTNCYGWPGLWPVFAEYASFDPTIDPTAFAAHSCTFGGNAGSFAYGGVAAASATTTVVADYECDYSSLTLPDRKQDAWDPTYVNTGMTMNLEPDALGYTVWKQGMWAINYWGTLQDTGGNGITSVDPADLPQVGQPGNTVVGQYPDPTDPLGIRMVDGAPGVYLGDIPMEGWQGLTMMEEIDNKAQFLLNQFLTPDGATLTGFPSIAAALQYSYDSPLLFFPASVAVTEAPTTTIKLQIYKYFAQPTSFAIADGSSSLTGLCGLLGGFAEAFAFTDRNNALVGGSAPFEATFDGDPFPLDDGIADGEATLHDRTLGVLKVALVDLDRMHFDPSSQALVDSASVVNGQVVRGTHVTTLDLTEAILALRNVFRTLNGSLQLYSNDTPDTLGGPTALDGVQLSGASYTSSLSAHLIDLIRMQANFLSSTLITPDGQVANGYDLSAGKPDATPSDLVSEAAAIRGLLDAYLATSDEDYRTRAIQVYEDLTDRFWMTDVLAYRTTAGQDGTKAQPLQYTPIRVGMLSGALRQYYKLVASSPSRGTEGMELLGRMKRIYKLVLNGWNDRNQDDVIQYPDECLDGGMEMGERALTGELGHSQPDGGATWDRDNDCVREISVVHLPAAMGAEFDLSRE